MHLFQSIFNSRVRELRHNVSNDNFLYLYLTRVNSTNNGRIRFIYKRKRERGKEKVEPFLIALSEARDVMNQSKILFEQHFCHNALLILFYTRKQKKYCFNFVNFKLLFFVKRINFANIQKDRNRLILVVSFNAFGKLKTRFNQANNIKKPNLITPCTVSDY